MFAQYIAVCFCCSGECWNWLKMNVNLLLLLFKFRENLNIWGSWKYHLTSQRRSMRVTEFFSSQGQSNILIIFMLSNAMLFMSMPFHDYLWLYSQENYCVRCNFNCTEYHPWEVFTIYRYYSGENYIFLTLVLPFQVTTLLMILNISCSLSVFALNKYI